MICVKGASEARSRGFEYHLAHQLQRVCDRWGQQENGLPHPLPPLIYFKNNLLFFLITTHTQERRVAKLRLITPRKSERSSASIKV